MIKSAWFVGFTPQLATAVFMTKENKKGIPVSLSGTGGRETVTGGSFPASIWTGFMKGALKKTDVAEFPDPPKGSLKGMECPEILPPDMEEVPLGCPTPEVIEEFGPDPGLEEANPEDPEQLGPDQGDPSQGEPNQGEPNQAESGEEPADPAPAEQSANEDGTVTASAEFGAQENARTSGKKNKKKSE